MEAKAEIEVGFSVVGGTEPCGAKIHVRVPYFLRSVSPVAGEPVTVFWGTGNAYGNYRYKIIELREKDWKTLEEEVQRTINTLKMEILRAYKEFKELNESKPAGFDITLNLEENTEHIKVD